MIFLSTLTEGLYISLFSVAVVFVLLGLIALVIQSLKYVHKKPKPIPLKKDTYIKPFELSDIKDEDMMVAALVASIDYFEETKENVRVISIKEINQA
jgi:Na+-transporting methylmalonyl-CoA/oxaloacetate decarboxylase gamma subunit